MVARLVALVLALVSGAVAEQTSSSVAPSAELARSGERKVPDAAQEASDRALASFAKGDLAKARDGFRKVLDLAPGNLPSMINLGLVECRAKNYREAERLLRQAVRKEPETGLGWFILGVVYYEQERLDAAFAALAQAALYEPKDPRVHQYLGLTVGKKGWYSGAEDEMRKAIELAPDYAEAHFNLSVFYLQRSPPAIELARRHYQKALDLGAAPDTQVEKSLAAPSD